MSVAELIQNLTRSQLDDMVSDFNRLLGRQQQLAAERQPLGSILSHRKYGAVCRALGHAQAAGNKGEEAQAHFMNGMAAAFYGLVRLIEAKEMEKTLGARLGLSGPEDNQCQVEETSSRKDTVMLDTQKQFAFEDLVAILQEDGVKFTSREEEGFLMAGFSGGRHGPVQLLARVDGQRDVLTLSFRLPLTIPEDKRLEMAEAVTRANYGLVVGSFEMDMRDGELNYKVVVPIDEAMLSHAQFRHCMGAALMTVQRYLPAYYRIVFSGTCPEEAINECES